MKKETFNFTNPINFFNQSRLFTDINLEENCAFLGNCEDIFNFVNKFYKNSTFYFDVYKLLNSDSSINEKAVKKFVRRLEKMNIHYIFGNPPWGSKENVGLGFKILKAIWNILGLKKIVWIYGENEFYRNTHNGRKEYWEHANKVRLLNKNTFAINSRIDGIYVCFDPNRTFNGKIEVIDDVGTGWNGVFNTFEEVKKFPKEFIDLMNTTIPEYDKLKQKYGSMTHGDDKKGNRDHRSKDFVYYENKAKLKEFKNAAAEGSKYILNRTSYENNNDPFFDYVKNKGGITWTCKNKNVKTNISYWLHDTPLVYAWRKWKVEGGKVANCFVYDQIPAMDFDVEPEIFKKRCNKLCDNFNKKYTIDDIQKYMGEN